MPAELKPESSESRRNFFSFFFYPGRTRLVFPCMLGRDVASTVLLVPRSLVGGDSVDGQRLGDKECPCNDVTSSGLEDGAGKRSSECGICGYWRIHAFFAVEKEAGLAACQDALTVVLNFKIQTRKRFRITPFIRTKDNKQIFGVTPPYQPTNRHLNNN